MDYKRETFGQMRNYKTASAAKVPEGCPGTDVEGEPSSPRGTFGQIRNYKTASAAKVPEGCPGTDVEGEPSSPRGTFGQMRNYNKEKTYGKDHSGNLWD